jgi:hypothetical protein
MHGRKTVRGPTVVLMLVLVLVLMLVLVLVLLLVPTDHCPLISVA